MSPWIATSNPILNAPFRQYRKLVCASQNLAYLNVPANLM
jgi:hypothetical protein